MRTTTKAAIIAAGAALGWFTGMVVLGLAWLALEAETVDGGSGNSRDQYLWPFLGSTVGAIAGAAAAAVLIARRPDPDRRDPDLWSGPQV